VAGTGNRASAKSRNIVTVGVAMNQDSVFEWRGVGAQVSQLNYTTNELWNIKEGSHFGA
jgi:hypothetical protein